MTGAVLVTACGDGGGEETRARASVTTGRVAEAGACEPGRFEVDGAVGRRFCGPASADLTIGTARLRIDGGECRTTEGQWSATLGAAFPDAAEPPAGYPYAGLAVGAAGSGLEIADGTYPDALLSWTTADGTTGQGTGTVTLSQGTSTAVFEGTSLFTGEEILGTVHCN